MMLAGALPLVGLYALAGLLPDLPPELLRGVSVFAVFGALYGSLKALVQVRAVHLVAYGSLAFYSILWWHLGMAGRVTPQAAVYAGSAALVTAGLLLAWDRVRVRYGDLALTRIGGLAWPMPRLATLLALLVMGAAGLPPFGLFSGYIALLLDPVINLTVGTSMGLAVMVFAWFAASWYLFRLMQRLLFGPYRADLLYQDLSRAEAAPLVVVLVLLLAAGIFPNGLIAFGARGPLTAWNP
jgi:NADH-quinone oxidoreductase subunit M